MMIATQMTPHPLPHALLELNLKAFCGFVAEHTILAASCVSLVSLDYLRGCRAFRTATSVTFSAKALYS
jgi:hypothetical protein